MAENPNIDKWDLTQTFPKDAKARCPYCSSTNVYNPFSTWDKVKRFTLFALFGAWEMLFLRRQNDAAYPRRKCSECGFEYSIKTHESLYCWIGLLLIVAAYVALAVWLRYSRPG